MKYDALTNKWEGSVEKIRAKEERKEIFMGKLIFNPSKSKGAAVSGFTGLEGGGSRNF